MRFASLALIALVSLLAAALAPACSSDPACTGSCGSGGSTGVTTGSTSTSTGEASPLRHCVKACSSVSTCCAGDPTCPSETYPNNVACEGGACADPSCKVDADCHLNGPDPSIGCVAIPGLPSELRCALLCATEMDCIAGTHCSSTDTGGRKYCGCLTDDECGWFGKCNAETGLCTCRTDADCPNAEFSRCVDY